MLTSVNGTLFRQLKVDNILHLFNFYFQDNFF